MLPRDGSTVEARIATGTETSRRPTTIRGELHSWWVDGLDYVQTEVGGELVEPSSIRLIAGARSRRPMADVRYRVDGGDRGVRAWSTRAMPFEPTGAMLELRSEVRTALGRLQGTGEGWLSGLYVSPSRRVSDLENDLTYNVGIAAFAGVASLPVRFTRAFARPSPQEPTWEHYYRWRVGRKPDRSHWDVGEAVATVEASLPQGPIQLDGVWLAVRHGRIEVASTASASEPVRLAVRLGADVDAIRVMKSLIDGLMAGLTIHHDESSAARVAGSIAARLGRDPGEIRELLTTGPMAIDGAARLVWPRGTTHQWNPPDSGIVWLDVETRVGPPQQLTAELSRVAIS